MGGRAVLLLIVSLGLSASAALGAGEAELCDALAGEGPAATVPFEEIDAAAAVAACAAAVAVEPANPRLLNQYARALERAGRIEDARRLYGWAAADGHAEAQIAVARLDAQADPGWTNAQRDYLTTTMGALAGGVRRYGNTLPPDPTDPLAVLAVTGNDTVAIAAWVASETRLVPYLGSLRGARGVLLDRAGNSLDRALALALLLNQAGEEVRIARTTLSPSQAEALFTTGGAGPAPETLPALAREDLQALLADPRLPPDLVETAITRFLEQQAEIERLLQERMETLVPAILPAVMANAAGADEAARDAAVEALQDYFWVQVRAGAAWRDVVVDEAVIGTPIATETFAVDTVPQELRHSVTIRVVLELQEEAARREEVLLTHVVYPADAGYQTLSLSHLSPAVEAMDQAVAGGGDVAGRISALLEGATAWTPVIELADEAIVERLFTRDGELRDADVNAIAQAGATMGNLMGEAANLLGGGEPVAVEPAIPTAEWLEIAVYVPGAGERTERRTIFDLLGPAAREAGGRVTETPELARERALRLVGITEFLIAGATPSDTYLARLSTETIARIADNAVRIAGAPTLPDFTDIAPGPKVPLALLVLANQRLSERSGALTGPNVFLSHFRMSPEEVPTAEFDIVFNDLPGQSFEEQVLQGVYDTILEDALATAGTGPNVATLHMSDIAAGRPWAAVGDIARLPADTDTQARAAADIAAGYAVIAPAAAPTGGDFGWWRIDPRTGRTLGIMANGGGATAVETAYVLIQSVANGVCFGMVGIAMVSMISGQGLGGGYAGGTMLACAAVAAGGALGAGTGVLAVEIAAGGGVGIGLGGAATVVMLLIADSVR